MSDKNHVAAKSWMKRNREPLITIDLVIVETMTLLKMRRQFRRALEIGDALFEHGIAESTGQATKK